VSGVIYKEDIIHISVVSSYFLLDWYVEDSSMLQVL
jgi:hypothetical protein